MFILAWDPTDETKPRARAFATLEEACTMILTTNPFNPPDHVVRLSANVFKPGEYNLRYNSLSDFMRIHHALLKELPYEKAGQPGVRLRNRV